MVAYRRKHEISLPEFSFRRPRLSGYLAVGFARLAAQGLLLAVFDAPGASWRLLALPGVLSRTLNRKTSTRNLRPYTLNLRPHTVNSKPTPPPPPAPSPFPPCSPSSSYSFFSPLPPPHSPPPQPPPPSPPPPFRAHRFGGASRRL